MKFVTTISLPLTMVDEWKAIPAQTRSRLVQRLLSDHFKGNVRKVVEEKTAAVPEVLRVPVAEYVKYRKEINKPMSSVGVTKLLKKLEQMYPGDPKSQASTLEQSIVNGWSGVFELKEQAGQTFVKKGPQF